MRISSPTIIKMKRLRSFNSRCQVRVVENHLQAWKRVRKLSPVNSAAYPWLLVRSFSTKLCVMKNQDIRLIWDWLHPKSSKQVSRNRRSNPKRRIKSGRHSLRHCKQTSGHPARLPHSKSKVTQVRKSLNLCPLLRLLLSWTTEFHAPTAVVSLKSK
jgi:hypothetical protein